MYIIIQNVNDLRRYIYVITNQKFVLKSNNLKMQENILQNLNLFTNTLLILD